MSTENDEIINSLIRQINNFDKALQHAAARSDITLLGKVRISGEILLG
ncbi:hypothetical protein [Escherichia coli]|nr:hypothetical protein [Escherichia coli]